MRVEDIGRIGENIEALGNLYQRSGKNKGGFGLLGRIDERPRRLSSCSTRVL